MSIVDDKIGAKDLDKVVMVTNNVERKLDSHFSTQELLYQEGMRDSVRLLGITLSNLNNEKPDSKEEPEQKEIAVQLKFEF